MFDAIVTHIRKHVPLDEADAQAAFNRWPEVYQATGDGRAPIWALRHGANADG